MRIVTISTLVLAAGLASAGEGLSELTPEQWRADLKFLVETLPARHIKPFARVSKREWLAAASSLDSRIPAIATAPKP